MGSIDDGTIFEGFDSELNNKDILENFDFEQYLNTQDSSFQATSRLTVKSTISQDFARGSAFVADSLLASFAKVQNQLSLKSDLDQRKSLRLGATLQTSFSAPAKFETRGNGTVEEKHMTLLETTIPPSNRQRELVTTESMGKLKRPMGDSSPPNKSKRPRRRARPNIHQAQEKALCDNRTGSDISYQGSEDKTTGMIDSAGLEPDAVRYGVPLLDND